MRRQRPAALFEERTCGELCGARITPVPPSGADASAAADVDLLTTLYTEDRRAAERGVQGAEQAIREHRYDDAVAIVTDPHPARANFPDLVLRALFAESWARMYLGQLEEAVVLLEHGRAIAEQSWFSDVEHADALFRLGCCRFKLSRITTAGC